MITLRKKGTKAVTGAVSFQKGTLLYLKGAYWHHNCTNMYHEGTNIGKRYRPSDSFRTFFFWECSFLQWFDHLPVQNIVHVII